jgi:hypothetical protein
MRDQESELSSYMHCSSLSVSSHFASCRLFVSIFCDIVSSLCFMFQADHNFENIEPHMHDKSLQIGHEIPPLTHSSPAISTRAAFHAMSMPAKPLAPDKHCTSFLIINLTILLLTFCALQQDSEGEIRSSSLCGSAIWLPRRHRSLWTFCESSNHDHLIESSFVPHVLSVSTTESKRAPHIGFSNIPDFLERYFCTFISLPTLLQRVSNHGNKYWFLIDMFLTSQLHAHTHLFTYISTLYRHFLVSSTYANATSEDLSLRPSRTTPGIELTMAWAPTSHR